MIAIPLFGITEPFSSITHLVSAGAALCGLYLLARKGRGNPLRIFSLVVFSITLIFLFSMSGAFHWLELNGAARGVLQRMDYAGIWALIAGTFTPIHSILFRGPARWGILLLVWIFGITGLVLQVVFFDTFPKPLALFLFLGMGWIGLFSMIRFAKNYADPSIKYLIYGSLSYTAGAILDFMAWPIIIPGVIQYHEIFHVAVIFGASFHWYFIYCWANHPLGNEITFEVRSYPSGEFAAQAFNENITIKAFSKEDVLEKIQEQVRQTYHNSIVPTIRLRHVKEEFI